jgi:hypothetical protein
VTTEQPMTEDVRDFSVGDHPIPFRIGKDVFYARANVATDYMIAASATFVALGDDAPLDKYIDAVKEMMKEVLVPESVEPFIKGLSDRDKPIGLQQINQIVPWLMETYTGRPTEAPDSSSNGQPSPESGTSSTGDTPPSTSLPFPQPSSLTSST